MPLTVHDINGLPELMQSLLEPLNKRIEQLTLEVRRGNNSREFTREEAAAELNISVVTLDRRRKAGLIGYLPNPIRFTQAHLDEHRKSFSVPAIYKAS